MPRLPDVDSFPEVEQEEDTLSCVPACVRACLTYLGVPKDWEVIISELDYCIDDGTPFENITFLTGVEVYELVSVAEIEAPLSPGACAGDRPPPHRRRTRTTVWT